MTHSLNICCPCFLVGSSDNCDPFSFSSLYLKNILQIDSIYLFTLLPQSLSLPQFICLSLTVFTPHSSLSFSPACSHVPRVSAPKAGDPGPLGAPHGPVPAQGGWHYSRAAQPDGLAASSDEALGHHAAHHTVSFSAPLAPPPLWFIFFSLWLSPPIVLNEPLPPSMQNVKVPTGVG